MAANASCILSLKIFHLTLSDAIEAIHGSFYTDAIKNPKITATTKYITKCVNVIFTDEPAAVATVMGRCVMYAMLILK